MLSQPLLRTDSEAILASIMPLVGSTRPLLRRQIKVAAVVWYSCHYGITNQRDDNPRYFWASRPATGWIDREFIRKSHFVSDAVLAMMNREADVGPVRLEHILPFGVALSMLTPEHAPDTAALSAFLIQHKIIGFVTDAEDKQLREVGLNSQMPGGWTEGDDPLARYAAAGIGGVRLRNFKTGIALPSPFAA